MVQLVHLGDELHVERTRDFQGHRDGAAYILNFGQCLVVEILRRSYKSCITRVHTCILNMFRYGHTKQLPILSDSINIDFLNKNKKLQVITYERQV